jgi:hypothetical protein
MVQTQIQTLKYEQSITISKVRENNFHLNIKSVKIKNAYFKNNL